MKRYLSQLFLLFAAASLCACGVKREEIPVIPPETSPLSRDYIGYGVITASFTHITADPSEQSPSLGYLRRGSLVRVVRRQLIRNGGVYVSWVLIDGNENGWLKEDVMEIFDSESQARTASETILR